MKRDVAGLGGRTFDLLVVGAGITGAAAAWDAAQRGLSVALVDAFDFGAATSWNSLKTIHGGLRHLQRLDLAGVRESVRERRALLRIAPSLVAPLAFVVPARGRGARGTVAFRIAAALYNLLSRDRNAGLPAGRQLAPARVLSAAETSALAPALGDAARSGGLWWQDAQVDRPERLLLAFVEAAARQGACCANYVEALRLVREAGRVTGAALRDAATGQEISVRAQAVLVTAGPGLDSFLERSGLPPTGQPWLSAVNVVLRSPAPAAALGGQARGRNLFLVPWRGRTMLGTDYAPRTASPAEQVRTLLGDGALAFPSAPCRPEDVTLVHHGFVPGQHAAALQSRDEVTVHAAGLVSATAAKYTTARALAERAIDTVLTQLGRGRVPCRTAETALPVPDPPASLEEAARRAVHEEMARYLADAVLRRTDIGIAGFPEDAALERVLAVMAAEMGWDALRAAAEREAVRARYPLQ